MPKEIDVLVLKAISDRVFPGCVIGVVLKNGTRVVRPYGGYTYELDSGSVTEQSVYDLASITKSIPTAALAASLIHERKLSLNDLVKKYLPELQSDYGATVEDLLRYRVK